MRATGQRAVWVVLFVMWGEFFRHMINLVTMGADAPDWNYTLPALAFWLARELAWWWLITLMLSVLLRCAWDAPVTRALIRRRAG